MAKETNMGLKESMMVAASVLSRFIYESFIWPLKKN
jgi:hypothetical protein